MGKMIFPDGTVKEGYFEYNVFKCTKQEVANLSQNDIMRSTRASSNFYAPPSANNGSVMKI